MKTKVIMGLSRVQSQYDTFLIDLWGVVHNGIELYPGAISVLGNLHKLNKRFVLISNAPRPSKSVEKYLKNLKMNKAFLKNVFTSGEASLQTIKKNVSEWNIINNQKPIWCRKSEEITYEEYVEFYILQNHFFLFVAYAMSNQ